MVMVIVILALLWVWSGLEEREGYMKWPMRKNNCRGWGTGGGRLFEDDGILHNE